MNVGVNLTADSAFRVLTNESRMDAVHNRPTDWHTTHNDKE